MNNNPPELESQKLINSSQLSYKGNIETEYSVSMATDKPPPKEEQHVQNKILDLKTTSKIQDKSMPNKNSNISSFQNTINIQLLYNINQATEQDTWDRDFYSISFHSLLKHLSSNTNNIKKLLYYITKYILNKKIENNKANKINDLKDIDKVA